MIVSIYAVLLGLALVLIITGYGVNKYPLQLVGFGFLFLMGINLIGGAGAGIDYVNGTIESTSGNNTITSNDYATYHNNMFGFYLAVISMLGWAMVFLEYKGEQPRGL